MKNQTVLSAVESTEPGNNTNNLQRVKSPCHAVMRKTYKGKPQPCGMHFGAADWEVSVNSVGARHLRKVFPGYRCCTLTVCQWLFCWSVSTAAQLNPAPSFQLALETQVDMWK